MPHAERGGWSAPGRRQRDGSFKPVRARRETPYFSIGVSVTTSTATTTGDARSTLLSLTVTPVWNTIRGIRANVAVLLADYPPEFRYTAAMVASELLENAFKYGQPVPGAPLVSFDFGISDGVLRIETSNGATDSENMRELRLNIERLGSADDKMALYLARLQEIAGFPAGTSRLGLYRIVAEADFNLSYSYDGAIVRVIATRPVP